MASSTFSIFQSEIEKDIQLISKKIGDILSNSYSTLDNAKCQTKSIWECEGTSTRYCLEDYPRLDGCASSGAKITDRSGVLLPNNVDPNQGSNEQKLLICATTKLDEIFKEIKKKYTNQVERMYIGLSSGVFRAFPGLQKQKDDNGKCIMYDCRGRPWYIGAITGSKKVIIAIDTSAPMSSYIKDVTNAAISQISTLGLNDFVGLVRFNRDIQIEKSQSLERATSIVKDDLIGILKSINANTIAQNTNISNYGQAIQHIDWLFKNVPADEAYGAPCPNATNIVLFISANSPTEGGLGEELIRNAEEMSKETRMKFYSYGLGNAVDNDLLKNLSCRMAGTSFKIGQNVTLSKSIRHYESFIRSVIGVNSAIWSEPYNDANTGKRTFTISTQIHQYIDGRLYVVGAAGIDVTMENLIKNFNISEIEAVKKLMKCTPTENVTIDKCELENNRPLPSRCGVYDCEIANEEPPECSIMMENVTVIEKPAISGDGNQASQCCGLTTGAMIGAVTAFCFVLLAFIVGLLIWYFRYRKPKIVRDSQLSSQSERRQSIGQSTMNQLIKSPKKQIEGSEQSSKKPVLLQLQQKEVESKESSQKPDKKGTPYKKVRMNSQQEQQIQK